VHNVKPEFFFSISIQARPIHVQEVRQDHFGIETRRFAARRSEGRCRLLEDSPDVHTPFAGCVPAFVNVPIS
jgi:hypothetical protein